MQNTQMSRAYGASAIYCWLTLSYSDQSPIIENVKGKALKQIKIKTDTVEVRGMSIFRNV